MLTLCLHMILLKTLGYLAENGSSNSATISNELIISLNEEFDHCYLQRSQKRDFLPLILPKVHSKGQIKAPDTANNSGII